MELANASPLAARIRVWDGDAPGRRDGLVVAKGTWQYSPEGAVSLDIAKPFPLLDRDEATPFGIMPRDDLARDPSGFEVIFLGSAHAPRGSATTELTVSLRVGEVERSLCVLGDRVVRDGVISAPLPFTRMDIGWSNAFGGSAEVLIDRDAPVVVCDQRNPSGKGFDPLPQALALCEALKAPKGYPEILAGARALPNVEDPAHRITAATDAPEPASWATRSLSSAAHGLRAIDLDASQRVGSPVLTDRAYHRAVDEWIIERPREGAVVELHGLDPDGAVRFSLPRLRVACDFQVGASATTLELLPEVLLIVGPWRRFTVLYRARFHYWEYPDETASARLWTRDMGGER